MTEDQLLFLVPKTKSPKADAIHLQLIAMYRAAKDQLKVMAEMLRNDAKGARSRKTRKGPFDGPHGQLYELIQVNEGRGPNGERTPWVTSLEQIGKSWPGPVGRRDKLAGMLEGLIELGWVIRLWTGIGGARFELRTCTEEERSASAAAMTSRQLNLPEPQPRT